MSFINFNHPQRTKTRRTKRNEASNKRRYKAWSRRQTTYVKVKVKKIAIPSAPSASKDHLSHHQQPTSLYTNLRWAYFHRPTPEIQIVYEWVNTEGCLIGLREIYVIV